MNTTFKQEFVRVSRTQPCLQCGKPDWCAIHKSGKYGICQRVETAVPCGSAGWRYGIKGGVSVAPPETPTELSPEDLNDAYAQFRRGIRTQQKEALARTLQVKVAALDELGIGWNSKQQCFTFPMYDAANQLVGFHFRDLNGCKWSLEGSRLGLFIPMQAVLWISRGLVVVTEGVSDCAAVMSQGFLAIARPNRGFGDRLFKQWRRHNCYRERVLVVADNDPDGLGVESARQFVEKTERIIVPRVYKDARECIINGGGGARFEAAVRGEPNEFWEIAWQA